MAGRVDGGRITPIEGGLLVVGVTLPWVEFMVSLAIGVASQDAWLAALPVTLAGLGLAALAIALARRFPGATLIGLALRISGRPLGYLIGAAYVAWFTSVGALTARGFGEVITTMVLPRTPMAVAVGALIVVAAFNVRGGIEVVARANQVVVPVVALFLASLIILSVKDVHPQNWQPVLEHGISRVWRASYIAAGAFGEVMVAALVVLPFVHQRPLRLRILALPVIALGILMMGTSLWYVGVLGSEISTRLVFLPVEMAKHVSVGNFIERLQAVAVSFLMMASFTKLSIWYYGATAAAAELLGLQDYRSLAWPFGLLIGTLALFMFEDQARFIDFVRWSATPYMLLFEAAIPLLLWGAACARGVRGSKAAATSEEPPSPPRA